MPKLYLPAPSTFVEVERLPTVGVGMLDLRLISRITEDELECRRETQVVPS